MNSSQLVSVVQLFCSLIIFATCTLSLVHKYSDRGFEDVLAELARPMRSHRFARTMRMDRHYVSTVLPTVYTVNYVLGYEDGFVVSEMRHGREVARTPVYDSLEDAAAAALRLNAGESPPTVSTPYISPFTGMPRSYSPRTVG